MVFSKKPVLIATFFLLLAIPATVFLALRQQEIRKKAAETVELPTFPQPEYAPGEVLVKLRAPLGLKTKAAGVAVNLDQTVARVDQVDTSILPPSLQEIDERFEIKEIEKVFKGAGDPKAAVAAFKANFPQRAAQVSSEAETIDFSRTYKLVFDDQEVSVEAVIQELALNPEVEYAEPNYIFRTQVIPVDPEYPNDPYYLDNYNAGLVDFRDPNWDPPYDYQWNLKKINMEGAWNVATGSAEIKVAVVDTGVDYTHSELGSCTLEQVNNYQCAKVTPGYDFGDNDNDPMDNFGHGTHVAGIINAHTNNELGIAAIDHKTKILPVKISKNTGEFSLEVVGQGIKFSADQGASVINMSFGMNYPSNKIPETLKESLDYAYGLGSVLIAAAGNANDDITKGYWPANYYKVVAVGATNENDEKAPFSNFGSRIDLVAPGTETISLRANSTDLYCPDDCNDHIIGEIFYRASGTSFSSPTVAGVASLLLSRDSSLTTEETRQKLRIGADDLGTSGVEANSGHGRLNAYQSLLIEQSPPIALITSPSHMLSTNQETIQIKGTASSRDTVEFNLSFGNGPYPTEWRDDEISLTNNGVGPVVDGVLGELATSNLDEGTYTIKLEVRNEAGLKAQWRRSIYIDKSLHEGFPFETGDGLWSSPIISDLDNNGDKELIFGSHDHSLYVVDKNGSLLPGWPSVLGGKIYASPAVADFKSDGKKEMVVNTTQGKLYLIDWLGSVLWSVDTSNLYNTPTIGYFTQSENLEILILGYRGVVEIYDKDGIQIHSQILADNQGTYIMNPAIDDIDDDRLDEIFLAGRETGASALPSLRIYKYGGESYPVFSPIKKLAIPCSQPGGEFLTLAPTIGDIDLDGKKEAIISCSSSSFLGVWEIEGDGLKWSYSWDSITKEPDRLYPYFFGSPVTLANIDEDSELELIVQTGLIDATWSNLQYGLVVFEHDGQIKDGWPFIYDGRGAISPPVVVDLDNDGTNEIIAGEGSLLEDVGKKVYGLRPDALLVPGWPKLTNGGVRSSAAIDDLDGDGKIEVAIGSTDGNLYVWDTEGRERIFYDWPQYLHDERHAGAYTPLSFSFGQAVRFDPRASDECAYLSIPQSEQLLMGENFTIELWFKPDEYMLNPETAGSGLFSILTKDVLPDGGWGGYNLFISQPKTIHSFFHLQKEDGTYAQAERLLGTSDLLLPNQWHFLKLLKQGNNFTLFINGNQEGELSINESMVLTEQTVNSLFIAAWKPSNTQQCFSSFFGEIDEMRISNIARTDNSVPTEPFIPDANTMGLWHFDGDANDSSSNNLDGTEMGAIQYISYVTSSVASPSATPTVTPTPTPAGPTSTPSPTPTSTLAPTQTPTSTLDCPEEAKKGDYNCDGAVNLHDFSKWTSDYLEGKTTLSFFEYWRRVFFSSE